MTTNQTYSLTSFIMLVVSAVAGIGCQSKATDVSSENSESIKKVPQSVQDKQIAIDQAGIADQILNDALSDNLESKSIGPVEIVLRCNGFRLMQKWSHETNWREGITQGIKDAIEQVSAEQRAEIDVIQISLTHSFQNVSLAERSPLMTNIHRGVRGIKLSFDERSRYYGPLEMLARNQSFRRVIQIFREEKKISILQEDEIDAQVFETEQFLVQLDSPITITKMFRGNQVVGLDEVTQENIRDLAERMGDWMERQLQDDGRMPYKYWPSRGEESKTNNMIRQFMATICLGRLAEYRENQILTEQAKKNLRYNLEQYYKDHEEIGFIEFDRKVKLGAAGLAARAIFESPFRDEFSKYEKRLSRFIDQMQADNGRFQTFYKPPERDDNHNFYPGEAIYYWSAYFSKTGDLEVLNKLMRSYEYYRKWHLKNRNPAFIPWHTQTYYEVWKKTRNAHFREWIFEMNDWLLGMQQWDTAVYPDTQGRFYDPRRPEFGVPHASSTGVYLEGLIDAFLLAREVGDHARQKAYQTAICRGLRSVLQLEMKDETDLYYISRREKVRGALRTTVYNNEIRVDNVQHNLTAILKILAAFSAEDYRP